VGTGVDRSRPGAGLLCLGGTAGEPGRETTDGQTLAIASDNDHKIRLWSVPDGRTTELTGHTNDTNSVAFAPDGKTLASDSQDGTIRLWRLPHG
jgi:WD40 repeat protein